MASIYYHDSHTRTDRAGSKNRVITAVHTKKTDNKIALNHKIGAVFFIVNLLRSGLIQRIKFFFVAILPGFQFNDNAEEIVLFSEISGCHICLCRIHGWK